MPKNKEDDNIYTRIYGADKSSLPGPTGEQFQDLINEVRSSSADSGGGSMLGIQAGRKALGDISSAYRQFGKNIGDYGSYLESAVQRGTMAPELAEQSYLSAAMFSNAKKPFEEAARLGTMEQGFVDPKKYEKFKPFMQLTAKDMLGRQFTGDEMAGYIEAARGLGISKGQDFAAFLGNTVLTSPEARNREVVVDRNLFKDKSKTTDELLAMKQAFLSS
jgi:hypothetical protein